MEGQVRVNIILSVEFERIAPVLGLFNVGFRLERPIQSIVNFGILLVLYIYIYSLVGLQLLANTMHFGPDGYAIDLNEPGYEEASVRWLLEVPNDSCSNPLTLM